MKTSLDPPPRPMLARQARELPGPSVMLGVRWILRSRTGRDESTLVGEHNGLDTVSEPKLSTADLGKGENLPLGRHRQE